MDQVSQLFKEDHANLIISHSKMLPLFSNSILRKMGSASSPKTGHLELNDFESQGQSPRSNV